MEIREERTDDHNSVLYVNREAFPAEEEALLVDLLVSRGKSVISLVAEDREKIIGHILFSEVSLDPPDSRWKALGLGPVSVLPENQGMGTGAMLIQNGLRRCTDAGYDIVVLLGNPAYYSRFGFRRAKDFGLDNEYGEDEAFMALELKDGALVDFNGLVKYQPEFKETGC